MQLIHNTAQKGFTLVELLIVVIILALLAAIVVPQFASSTDDAKVSSLDTTLGNVRSVIDLYNQQHGAYPGFSTAVGVSACGGTGSLSAGGDAQTFLDQLSMYTDAAGGACSIKDAVYKFGPYLNKSTLAANPITNVATIEVVAVGDLLMAGTVANGGWKYDTVAGKFIANDTTDPDGVGPEIPYDEH